MSTEETCYLVKTVEDIDAVLIPAEDPALPEDTAEQTKLSVCRTVSSNWIGTRKQFKLRNLSRTGRQIGRENLCGYYHSFFMNMQKELHVSTHWKSTRKAAEYKV